MALTCILNKFILFQYKWKDINKTSQTKKLKTFSFVVPKGDTAWTKQAFVWISSRPPGIPQQARETKPERTRRQLMLTLTQPNSQLSWRGNPEPVHLSHSWLQSATLWLINCEGFKFFCFFFFKCKSNRSTINATKT